MPMGRVSKRLQANRRKGRRADQANSGSSTACCSSVFSLDAALNKLVAAFHRQVGTHSRTRQMGWDMSRASRPEAHLANASHSCVWKVRGKGQARRARCGDMGRAETWTCTLRQTACAATRATDHRASPFLSHPPLAGQLLAPAAWVGRILPAMPAQKNHRPRQRPSAALSLKARLLHLFSHGPSHSLEVRSRRRHQPLTRR